MLWKDTGMPMKNFYEGIVIFVECIDASLSKLLLTAAAFVVIISLVDCIQTVPNQGKEAEYGINKEDKAGSCIFSVFFLPFS